jgi:class 3 adenylate cyclase
VNIAYAVFGEGPPFVYLTSFPGGVHLYSHLALSRGFTDQIVESGRQVIRYDARGSGSSDRDAVDFSLEAQLRDLEAVVDRLELARFALGGHFSGTQIAIAYAARHPDRVSRVVLRDPYASGADFYDISATRRVLKAMRPLFEEYWELMTLNVAYLNFGFVDSEIANEQAAAFRSGISARAYLAYTEATERTDVTEDLKSVNAPTLVTHSTDITSIDIGDLLPLAKKVAAAIPNSRVVTTGEFATVVDEFLREGEQPATARPPALSAASGLATILFTDLVGHTAMMSRLGDERGREVLREHERITREVLKAHSGTEVKTMGDGFMASFGSVTKAVECAVALQRAIEARNEKGEMGTGERIEVRCGLNAGEPIEEEGDLFGATVILASRIAAKADGGEILVADTVRGLCSGKGFLFADRGEFVAKGFEEPMRVYEVRWKEEGDD